MYVTNYYRKKYKKWEWLICQSKNKVSQSVIEQFITVIMKVLLEDNL